MARERRDFIRPANKRDATLYIIATEGEKTEPKYFNALVSKEYFYNTKIHIEILTMDYGNSPRQVINRLNTFKKKYNLNKSDELWLVIDRDYQSWNESEISEIAQQCLQKGYFLGLSNPCFELWLLLHLEDISSYSKTELLNSLNS